MMSEPGTCHDRGHAAYRYNPHALIEGLAGSPDATKIHGCLQIHRG